MTRTAERALQLLGEKAWMDHQADCFVSWELLEKMCVYYPTGKGKTKTMLTCMWLRGVNTVVVVAPPITHNQWRKDAQKLGMQVICMSHATFRKPDVKFQKTTPIIVDEFHLLGGHTGQGWKKLDALAKGLKAELIIGSATPNYNDAERCYCIMHVLDPYEHKGGYIAWLYANCITEEHPFRQEPIVTGFRNYGSAEAYLASQPGVVYLPDEAPDILVDIPVSIPMSDDFELLNLDLDKQKVMASAMEKKHRKRFKQIVQNGQINPLLWEWMERLSGDAQTPTIIFCAHATIATEVSIQMHRDGVSHLYIDGETSKEKKLARIEAFKGGAVDFLVGTATLATGTDGLDVMCKELIILDDTEDDALRRQLVGRILPRGTSADYAGRYAHRFIFND